MPLPLPFDGGADGGPWPRAQSCNRRSRRRIAASIASRSLRNSAKSWLKSIRTSFAALQLLHVWRRLESLWGITPNGAAEADCECESCISECRDFTYSVTQDGLCQSLLCMARVQAEGENADA